MFILVFVIVTCVFFPWRCWVGSECTRKAQNQHINQQWRWCANIWHSICSEYVFCTGDADFHLQIVLFKIMTRLELVRISLVSLNSRYNHQTHKTNLWNIREQPLYAYASYVQSIVNSDKMMNFVMYCKCIVDILLLYVNKASIGSYRSCSAFSVKYAFISKSQ